MLKGLLAGLASIYFGVTGIFHAPHPLPATPAAAVEATATTSVNITASTTSADLSQKTLCNGQYWNNCPAGQLLVCPTNGSDAYCSTPKTPGSAPAPTPKKTAPVQTVAPVVQTGQIFCGGKPYSPCTGNGTPTCLADGSNAYCQPPAIPVQPTQQTLAPQAAPIQTGHNYHLDLQLELKENLAIENSFVSWLQDTSNQFRSASLTLAGYNTGGLAGKVRDSAIDLANANVSVISSTISSANKWIATYQTALDALNSDPSGFVDINTFNKFETSDALDGEINGIKKSINSSLDSVMTSLRAH